ncbi:MAG: DUF262 domain-containing protein [Alistipes sp.]|nr:DUF262 domain-containing protein [Alistipes sp.]
MNQKIDITGNWNIQRIFNELENGNMKIPRFQRGYVWERSKIVKLLNSILEEHPIGSFFIWEADAKYANFCREIEELEFQQKPDAGKFKFIIDGQQRITSLYVALMGKQLGNVDYASICFNLDRKRFHIPTLKTEPNNIPAWKIFNQSELAAIQMEYVKRDPTTGVHYMEVMNECRRILDNYPISLIKTLNVELDEAVTIFENINQGGKRLSLFDLVHASVWSTNFDLRELISAFNEEGAVKIFGKLSSETFTQSLSLNIHNNCQKANQLNLTTQACQRVWDRTLECLRLSIDFVKTLGAQKIDILPYESLLPVLQYYFYKTRKNSISNNHLQLINTWYWTTVFSRRYSSSTLTRMKEDADWICRIVDGNTEERKFAITTSYSELRKINMKNKSVVKDGVLCILAANCPKDFNNSHIVTLDNTNASRANAKENHHFFPYSRYDDFNITQNDVNSLLNFAFISKILNSSISNKLPSEYLSIYSIENANIEQDLKSHFIDATAYSAAKENNFENFVAARGAVILAKINELCKVEDKSEVVVNEDEELDTSDDLISDFIQE